MRLSTDSSTQKQRQSKSGLATKTFRNGLTFMISPRWQFSDQWLREYFCYLASNYIHHHLSHWSFATACEALLWKQNLKCEQDSYQMEKKKCLNDKMIHRVRRKLFRNQMFMQDKFGINTPLGTPRQCFWDPAEINNYFGKARTICTVCRSAPVHPSRARGQGNMETYLILWRRETLQHSPQS